MAAPQVCTADDPPHKVEVNKVSLLMIVLREVIIIDLSVRNDCTSSMQRLLILHIRVEASEATC